MVTSYLFILAGLISIGKIYWSFMVFVASDAGFAIRMRSITMYVAIIGGAIGIKVLLLFGLRKLFRKIRKYILKRRERIR